METGVVIFKKEDIPEKNLVKTIQYNYHPPKSMKEEIIEDVKRNLKCEFEDYIMSVEVVVSMKEYERKPVEKKYWYDDKLKPNDDSKNT
jgi:hypothetical protein